MKVSSEKQNLTSNLLLVFVQWPESSIISGYDQRALICEILILIIMWTLSFINLWKERFSKKFICHILLNMP